MMRMTYQNAVGKKKLHKSFSDLLDWLHGKQPLNFFVEMRTKCMDYLSPSDLASLGQQPMHPSTPIIPTIGASASASPHGYEAELLLGSDSEDDDELVVGSDVDDD